MSSLKKFTDKATFRYEDVLLCLNGEVMTEIDALREAKEAIAEEARGKNRLGAAKPQLDDIQGQIDALKAEVADETFTIRFRQLPDAIWKFITVTHPPAKDNKVDANKGYSTRLVVQEAAEKSGHLVVDGKTESIDPDEWKDLWANLSGGDFDRIAIAVTMLNEQHGWANGEFLKKG